MPENRSPRRPTVFSRRRVLQAGGVMAAATTTGLTIPAAFGNQASGIDIDEIGPGVIGHSIFSGWMEGETLYLGTRYLSPNRIVGFHVPSEKVTETYELGPGSAVSALTTDGANGLYAGIASMLDGTNLYHCDLETGKVTEEAAIPDLTVRDVTVAPNGQVYVVGYPHSSDASQLYRYDPSSGDFSSMGDPNPEAGEGIGVVATEEHIYFACVTAHGSKDGRGLFRVDPDTGDSEEFREVYSGVTLYDDYLFVGNPVSVLDLNANEWRSIDIPAHAFAREGDIVYAAERDGNVHTINLETWETEQIAEPGHPSSWQILGVTDGKVVSAVDRGLVWVFDTATDETTVYDLLESGSDGGPEAPQSVGAGEEVVYVCGNRAVQRHDLSDDSTSKFFLPGESKDMVVGPDNVAYFAVYNQKGLYVHRPGEEEPEKIAGFPEERNRPTAVCWEEENEVVAIGIDSDTTNGGALCFYHPGSDEFVSHVDPLGEDQFINAVAVGHGLVYIGGATGNRAYGSIAAWDPVADTEVWRIDDPFQGHGIGALVVVGDQLMGITAHGPRFFALDLTEESATPVHIAGIQDYTAEGAALVVSDGFVYGVSTVQKDGGGTFFRVDPSDDYSVELLSDELNGDWFGGSSISVSPQGEIYTMEGRNLVRITDTTE